MRTHLFIWLFFAHSAWAQVTYNVANLDSLRQKIGGVGVSALVGTGSTFRWNNTATGPDNGVTFIQANGVSTGGWEMVLPDMGNVPMSVTSVTGTTETTTASKLIKGNTLGSSHGLSFLYVFSLSSGVSLLPGLTIKLKYGTEVFSIMSTAVIGSNLSKRVFIIRGRMIANGSPTAQYIYAELIQDAPTAPLTMINGSTVVSRATLATNSAVDQSFAITATLSTNTGNAILYPELANILFL